MDGLFLDRHGAWFHDGDPVRHARLAALLHRSIARDPAGHLIVTTGRDAQPFVAEDAPLLVRTLDGDDLVLSNETRAPLGDRPLYIDDDGRVRVAVGAFWALLSRSATQIVIEQKGPERLQPGLRCDWSQPPM